MTTPPPGAGDRDADEAFERAFDHDQTGMRDLLRSQPAPGPMPADVERRITAALQAQRAQLPPRADNVTPLGARPEQPYAATAAPQRPQSHQSHHRARRVVTGLVAAAAVAAVAVVGINALHQDDAPTSAVPSASSGGSVADRVRVERSGTDYTPASFDSQAAALSTSTAVRSPVSSDLASAGSLSSVDGILRCARTVGGAVLQNPDGVRVDFATFEGKPALIVVVHQGSTTTAFAVSTSCAQGAAPYAAPRTI